MSQSILQMNSKMNLPSPVPSPFPSHIVNLYGSSHAKYLREWFEHLRSEYSWCKPFNHKNFDARGGRVIGEDEVETMEKNIDMAVGPTIFVYILGSNDIRHFGHPSCVYRKFKRVLQYAKRFSNVHILIVSIIPSVVKQTKVRFAKASGMLKELVKWYPNASFLNMSRVLSPEGKVSKELFKTLKVYKGIQKNVHLNVRILYIWIKQHILLFNL